MSNLSVTIAVVGSSNMDIVIPVARLPQSGETIAGGDLAFFPGGKGANQACAASRLGAHVAMVARVGNDPFGSTLIAGLKEAGVDVHHIEIANRPSGCACIYVLPHGENSIVISAGANATLDPASALRRLEAMHEPAAVLLQLEIPIETVEAVLEWAARRRIRTVLDPAPARALSPALLCNTAILTPNQSEAASLIGRSREIRGLEDAAEAAAILLQTGPSAVVMKLGSQGCLVATAAGCEWIKGYSVQAVDTTAAGDAFNAALAVALGEGKQLTAAAAFANAAAAISVTRCGAQPSLPYRNEVNSFLHSLTGS